MSDTIVFGATVLVIEQESQAKRQYTLVGQDEALQAIGDARITLDELQNPAELKSVSAPAPRRRRRVVVRVARRDMPQLASPLPRNLVDMLLDRDESGRLAGYLWQ